MAVLRALNRSVDPSTLLRALGCPLRDLALPVRTTCPLCGKDRLGLYEDTISGGVWHYCFDCQSAGDLIELAASAWGVDHAGVVRRLEDLGVNFHHPVDGERVEDYLKLFVDRRRQVDEFWKRCRLRLAGDNSPAVARLRQRLHLASGVPDEHWLAGPGLLLGSACVREARDLLCRVKGSGEAVVAAFHDLHGRVSGLLLAGPDGRQFVGAATPCHGHGRKPAEAGLFGLPCLRRRSHTAGAYVLVCQDAFLAGRLHVRHVAVNDRPMPVLAYHEDPRYRTGRAYDALDGLRPVFWCAALTPSVVHQAMLSGGLVATWNKEACRDMSLFLRNNSTEDVFRRAVKTAVPWREAVARWSAEESQDRVLDLVLYLEAAGRGRDELRGLSGPVDAALDREPVRRVTMHRITVVEKEGRWYVEHLRGGPLELAMNAALRIDGVAVKDVYVKKTRDTHRGVVHYVGRLIYEGEVIPFEEPVSMMEHYAPRILQRILARANGAMLYVNSGFRKRLINAAKQFSGSPVR
jgi:hypothetical protein